MIGCFCWVMGAVVTACPIGLSFPLLWYSMVSSCWSLSDPLGPLSLLRGGLSFSRFSLADSLVCCCFRAANSEFACNLKTRFEKSTKVSASSLRRSLRLKKQRCDDYRLFFHGKKTINCYHWRKSIAFCVSSWMFRKHLQCVNIKLINVCSAM